MSNFLRACSALPLLSLVVTLTACGGDKPAAPPGPAQAPAPSSPQAPAAKGGETPKAPEPKKFTVIRFDADELKVKFGSEPKMPAADNKVTPEKIALGKLLYHEKAVSKNGNISCASCHDLANYGQDGKPTSPGTDGKNGDRNTPTSLNAFRQFVQFWDGRAATIEDQALMPVMNPVEHGVVDEKDLEAKLQARPELVAAFQKAFPGEAQPVTAANFQKAIGAFERQLVTKSRVDAFLDGDAKALTNEEKAGLRTFIDVGCTECHTSRMFGGDSFQKMGKYKPYASDDPGRQKISKADADKAVFKVPSLCNVEKTAPYFHDGKCATLEEAVRVMADIQLQKQLTDEQVHSLVAFLKALTGDLPAIAK